MTGGAAEPSPAGPARRDALLLRAWWVPVVLAALPLALGLGLLAQRTWYPIGDYAQANLRLLSFWRHPPLVGAAGRIVGPGGVQGNHPGPAQFWLSWPAWRALGGSSWAVNASVALTNLLGAAVAVACARRVGGRTGAAAVGVVALVLVGGYGPEVMLQPWNPSMPLLWFLALLVATWGVLGGHVGLLPVVAGTASYVVQCHTGYAPLALALCALAGGAALLAAARSADRAGALRRLAPWLGAIGAVAAVLWSPPAVDQLSHDPGNVTILLHSFSHPDEGYVGLGQALHLLVLQLDPTGGWLRGTEARAGLPVGGIALLGAWAASGIAARRAVPARWARLDAVLAVALVVGWLSISRIFGLPYVYLFKWTWVLTGLLVLATAAHLLAGARARPALPAWVGDGRLVQGGLAGLAVVGLVAGGLRFAATEVSSEQHSDTIAGLIGPTTAGLDPDARYLVTWRDPAGLGGVGFGMLLELERRGFDVGVSEPSSAPGEPHRVRAPDEVDAVVHVVSGAPAIDAALALPRAREVARFDARTGAERARAVALTERAARRLTEEGRAEQAATLRGGGNLFGVLLSGPLPDDVVADITELVALFLPTAVVVTPSTSG